MPSIPDAPDDIDRGMTRAVFIDGPQGKSITFTGRHGSRTYEGQRAVQEHQRIRRTWQEVSSSVTVDGITKTYRRGHE